MRESPIPVNGGRECVVSKQIKLEEDTVKKCDVPVAACIGPKKVATLSLIKNLPESGSAQNSANY